MNQNAQPSFETALGEIERILRDLEDGTATLDDSLAKYERGIKLLRSCYGELQKAEQTINLLTGTDESGRPVLQPFEHKSTAAKAPIEKTVAKTARKEAEPPF